QTRADPDLLVDINQDALGNESFDLLPLLSLSHAREQLRRRNHGYDRAPHKLRYKIHCFWKFAKVVDYNVCVEQYAIDHGLSFSHRSRSIDRRISSKSGRS